MSFDRISSADALKAVFGNKVAAIPRRDVANNRLEGAVKPGISNSFTISRSDKVFTIGSCFARNIESYLRKSGFDLGVFQFDIPIEELNQIAPFPTQLLNKYTPFSMTNEVRGAFGELDLERSLVEIAPNSFLDMQLHTDVGTTKDRAIERRAYVNDFNRTLIKEADTIVITLGLVECWFDKVAGLYTNQTPSVQMMKKFPERFQFEILAPDVVGKEVQNLVELFLKYGKRGHKVMLTVSPVPIGRSFSGEDVIVANCYSKSVLRTYAEYIKQTYDHVDYIPTYEAITLSDRANTWTDDNIHVTNEAVESIITHVAKHYLPESNG